MRPIDAAVKTPVTRLTLVAVAFFDPVQTGANADAWLVPLIPDMCLSHHYALCPYGFIDDSRGRTRTLRALHTRSEPGYIIAIIEYLALEAQSLACSARLLVTCEP